MISYSEITNTYYHNDKEITQEEYNKIKEIINNKPFAPDGYDYFLSDDLEWVLYEIEIEECENNVDIED